MASVTHDVVHEAAAEKVRVAQPYSNPYLAGIGLGLVLLAAFVLVGRGLGASGAFNSAIAWLVSLVAPAHARSNEFLGAYLEDGTHPLKAWLVFEVAGVLVGALLSGLLAGRVAFGIEKGPRVGVATRLILAFVGGALMAVGAAFVLVGRGLGASGAFNSAIAWLVSLVAPAYARSNEFLGAYLEDGTHPLKAWLVFEVAGVLVGAHLSGLLAGRVAFGVETGPRVGVATRLALAFVGGALMAVGAAFGRGCTSGQALTGGALLTLGSWVFMMCVFGGAYAVAWFVRRQWR